MESNVEFKVGEETKTVTLNTTELYKCEAENVLFGGMIL